MTGHAERPNKAPIKVVGVGLGRTGTASLTTALETLGIGPAYHVLYVSKTRNDFPKLLDIWYKDSSPEALDDLLQSYQCMLGFAAAMHAEALYCAYPDAKFILTVRDPDRWAKSVTEVLLPNIARLEQKLVDVPSVAPLFEWLSKCLLEGFFGGRLSTNPKQEYLDYNERIQNLIPKEQLLIFDVKDGWAPLTEFLGVTPPEEPFPHVNDAEQSLIRSTTLGVPGLRCESSSFHVVVTYVTYGMMY